ncbi:hypothetical protein AGMMS49521_0520 [Campylobacterota bacterium]|nr:hypothetical protein AGMMS49521_0520 [Campylobacterota bacterium]
MRVFLVLLAIAVFAWADTFNDGSMTANRGDHQDAVKQFTRAIKIDQNYVDAYINRGNAYYDLGDLSNASLLPKTQHSNPQ